MRTIDQLTEREQRARRKKQNIWKRISRLRQRENQNKNKSTVAPQHPNDTSEQARCGQKRIMKNIKNCFRDNTKLMERNRQLEKSISRLKKKVQRFQLKESEHSSPHTTVKKFLKKRRVPIDKKETLISGQVLIQQLRSSYADGNSNKSKKIFGRVLTGKLR